MSSVWYVGSSDQRIITSAEWTAAGFTGTPATSAWNAGNGWSIASTSFSSDQLGLLAELGDFQVNAPDGPRTGNWTLAPAGDFVTPATLNAAVATLNAAIAGKATSSDIATAIANLTAGSPDSLNTFLETYNRFLTDESAVSTLNAVIALKANSTDPRFTDARTPLAHSHTSSDISNFAAAIAKTPGVSVLAADQPYTGGSPTVFASITLTPGVWLLFTQALMLPAGATSLRTVLAVTSGTAVLTGPISSTVRGIATSTEQSVSIVGTVATVTATAVVVARISGANSGSVKAVNSSGDTPVTGITALQVA